MHRAQEATPAVSLQDQDHRETHNCWIILTTTPSNMQTEGIHKIHLIIEIAALSLLCFLVPLLFHISQEIYFVSFGLQSTLPSCSVACRHWKIPTFVKKQPEPKKNSGANSTWFNISKNSAMSKFTFPATSEPTVSPVSKKSLCGNANLLPSVSPASAQFWLKTMLDNNSYVKTRKNVLIINKPKGL